MNAREIIHAYCEGRVSGRPEFYSGYGASRSNIGPDHLEMIYGGVLKERGADAAKAFVALVAGAPSLAATAFLNALYGLEANDWVYTKRDGTSRVTENIEIAKDEEGNYAVGHGMMSMFAAMSSQGRYDETEDIRFEFLAKHKDETDFDFAGRRMPCRYRKNYF